ncbi:MAG: glycoside hydrolase family 43 protein [Ignavibacteriales bacterium]|nr:glycoside hydrolase family 43 protein [Ignavibacteriales bacterium]
MHRSLFLRFVHYAFGLLAGTALTISQNNPQIYHNPIISGFNPDPSICRVGEDYYLATSSFEYFPGVPVYHSRDLIHWTMIGHALDRASQLDLDSIACSGGIYAPTIRYHKGTFYMITTLVGQTKMPQHRNFIVTAKNPAGPWSEPHWIADAPGIDPSLFFDDDGKVYYSGNGTPPVKLWDKHRNIWVQELDLQIWQLVGKRVDVLDGGEYYKKGTLDGGIESGVNNYEASHLYKKDGSYYLLIAHGGTSQNHAVSIWKSENVFGPYQINPENPILTHRDLPKGHVFTSTGHADLVQTQNGEWWMVYLAKRPYGGENYIMGRETFMSPVDWSGTWPVVNPKGMKGRGELTHPKPNLPEDKVSTYDPKDDFNSPPLGKNWTFIRTPRTEWWSLTKRKGFLRIGLRPEMISEQVNPSFVGRRQDQKSFSAVVKMEFAPISENEEAGLVVERDKDYYFKFTSGMENGKQIVSLFQKNGAGSGDSLIAHLEIDGSILYMQINSKEHLYTFQYSYNGKDWRILKSNADGRLLGVAGAGRFTGTFIGMYASSKGLQSKNFADYDWFLYEQK